MDHMCSAEKGSFEEMFWAREVQVSRIRGLMQRLPSQGPLSCWQELHCVVLLFDVACSCACSRSSVLLIVVDGAPLSVSLSVCVCVCVSVCVWMGALCCGTLSGLGLVCCNRYFFVCLVVVFLILFWGSADGAHFGGGFGPWRTIHSDKSSNRQPIPRCHVLRLPLLLSIFPARCNDTVTNTTVLLQSSDSVLVVWRTMKIGGYRLPRKGKYLTSYERRCGYIAAERHIINFAWHEQC